MGELAKLPAPKRRLKVEDSAAALRRVDRLEADFPTLHGSLRAVRNDIAAQQERPATWSFIMIGPYEQSVILDRIASEAARPKISIRLWGAMLCRIAADTGEVKMSRKEMMAACGTKASSVISSALKEFQEWGALTRDRRDGAVHWFFNPRIGTHLPDHARPWAQRHAANVMDLAAIRNAARRHTDEGGTIHDERQTDLTT